LGNNYHHGFLHYPIFAFTENYSHGHIEEWHSHDRIQLIHTLSGVIRIQTVEGTWVTPPGRGVWIPANKPHALLINGEVQAYGVFIEPFARENLVNECRVVTISPLLKELIRSAMQIQNAVHPQSREERLLELILDELQLLHVLPFNLPEPQTAKLKKLCTEIRNELNHTWTLEQAAEYLHISRKTFTRHFQKETGMHFSHWVRQARLMQAMIDLAMDKPIFNVAIDLGYDSASAFSAMFKRETSLTPSEYIQQFRHFDATQPFNSYKNI